MSLKMILTDILSRASSKEQREEIEKTIAELGMKKPVTTQDMVKSNLEYSAKHYNEKSGSLNLIDGIDCPICKNKGMIQLVGYNEMFDYYSEVMKECECMKQRRSWQKIQSSGLAYALQDMTFDTFVTDYPWQDHMKTKAMEFVNDDGISWLYIGGQVGCGKSHICTAICGEFLKQNKTVRYMRWAEEGVRLKSIINDADYSSEIEQYKTPDILYIDDFFKVQRSANGKASAPTPADIRLAFEIIDYRYCAKKKTVISSEWTMDEILDFDEATSSRIYQRSKGYTLIIARNKTRNYRRFGFKEAI